MAAGAGPGPRAGGRPRPARAAGLGSARRGPGVPRPGGRPGPGADPGRPGRNSCSWAWATSPRWPCRGRPALGLAGAAARPTRRRPARRRSTERRSGRRPAGPARLPVLVLDADPASAEGTAALEGLLDRLGEGLGGRGSRRTRHRGDRGSAWPGGRTRLTPLTRVVPKPLLAPAGRPLVDLAVEASGPPARPGRGQRPSRRRTG